MFSLAFLGQSEADKYVAGMVDTDATIRGDIRTLINALVAAGVWSKLEYLGVIQNLAADTQRCLKRRASAFSWGSAAYSANNGIIATSTSGYISSGFDPDADATVLSDDSHTFGSVLTVAPSAPGHLFGRWDASTSIENYLAGYYQFSSPNWENRGNYLRFLNALHTVGASLSNGLMMFGGRQNSSTVFNDAGVATTGRTSTSVTRSGQFSAWGSGSDRDVYHMNWNNSGAPSASANTSAEFGAWFGAAYLTDAETDALAAALNTYLTARGAI